MTPADEEIKKTGIDEARLRNIVADVLSASYPERPLRHHLLTLHRECNPALLCAVFESVVWRIGITDYWIYFLSARSYQLLNRQEAALQVACAAARTGPNYSGAPGINRILFEFFCSRQRPVDAISVALWHNEIFPGKPFISEAEVASLHVEEDRGSIGVKLIDDQTTAGRMKAMVESVLAAPNEEELLLQHTARLYASNLHPVACILFECVCWRIKIRNYWTYYRMALCYRVVGRNDAAFLMAAFADQIGPKHSGSKVVGRELFSFFRRKGRSHEALAVFLLHAERLVHAPIATLWELRPMLSAAGLSETTLIGSRNTRPDKNSRENVSILPRQKLRPWTWHLYGEGRIGALDHLASAGSRPAINVARISNGELLIDSNSYVVCDAQGNAYPDLSIHDFPLLMTRHFSSLESAGEAVEQVYLDEAVIIGDRFSSPPNLCHFLLDQLTRLELYRRAGVDITKAIVIGGEPRAAFQKAALAKCGVAQFLHTARVAQVRVKRLWVSSNCKDMRHPAHQGARWAIEFLRGILRPERCGPPRRLYISRDDASARRVINETDVVDIVGQYDFEVLVPGRMPFDEQTAAFAQATHVIGPHGAGLTNIVLCPPDTKVLELFHPLYGTAAYASLAAEGHLQYSAQVCRDGTSDAPEFNDLSRVDVSENQFGNRDIRVDLTELRKWLEVSCAS